ncbi:unnamed protein product [Ranitomeya imitator]|uniref:Glucosamine-6-phosphate deaminase n=1 Tax=Ranitomeya imitator TaxID=111125 RepID=A0ABN9L995_9NEOB|nr:unnamed protein product [Ranitomeya imitator]
MQSSDRSARGASVTGRFDPEAPEGELKRLPTLLARSGVKSALRSREIAIHGAVTGESRGAGKACSGSEGPTDGDYGITVNMKLIILDDYDQASEWAAKYIRNRIIHFNPSAEKYFTLGLPTGSTPLECYKKLIEYHKNGDLSFKYVKTFNMDEYVGSAVQDPSRQLEAVWMKNRAL